MSKLAIYAIIFCYSLSMAFGTESMAQQKLLNDISIDLDYEGSSLIGLLKAIEGETNFSFMYSRRELAAKKVEISQGNWRMSDLLYEISSQSKVSIKRVNDLISLKLIEKDEALPSVSDKIQVPIRVTGKVTDESGEPLPGATVLEKGTSNGTVTDLDGNFSLSVSENASLVVSFVGFETAEVAVENQSVINVQLTQDMESLEEVVVVGYGTQQREEITSAVASVSEKDFVKGNTRDVGQLIQGKVAGVSIVNPSGDPSVGTSIRLRGTTTLNGAETQPLVIIDGIPGQLNTVAPEDIQSIDILKDGSAAAIYGVRGTNGVILITTKKARGGVKAVDYSANFSIQEITRRPELLTAADYRNQISAGDRTADWDQGSDTDWLDEITRTPFSQIHNLTLRGGSSETNYVANVNFRGLEGVMLHSDNDRFTARAEVNHKMFNDKVAVNVGILNWYQKIHTTADGESFNTDAYQQALRFNPTEPVYNGDGTYYERIGLFNYSNPVPLLEEASGRNLQQNTRLYSTINWYPIDGLTLKATGSLNNYHEDRGYYETKQHISNLRGSRNGYASRGGVEAVERLLDITAHYELDLGLHNVTFLTGYSYQDLDRTNHWMQNWDFPSDQFDFHRIQLGRALQEGEANMFSERYRSNIIGVFGRINYAYDNKYLAMFSVRREGASNFWGAEQPWGTFPAASVGWRISEESFMGDLGFVNDLKLRFGYGVTGSRPENLTLGVPILAYTGNFYYDGQWIQTLAPTQNPNPFLKWEEKHEYNYGIDFSILDSRVYGSVDYYLRQTKDLLYNYPVPVPPNLVGFTTANAARIDNRGVEVAINYDVFRKADFEWTTTVLFSTNATELVSLGSDVYESAADSIAWNLGGLGEPILNQPTHLLQEGQPIGNFLGPKVVDITEDGQWIYENKQGEQISEVSEADFQVLGNGLPNYYASWNNQLRFKSFDLSVTMRGAFDYQILNSTRVFFENPTIAEYNRLKSSRDLVFGKAVLAEELQFNSYYIEDGDYWKIDNITLGYTFPEIIKGVDNFRIFVSTLNTFIFTGYSGIDPEVGQLGLNPGIDDRFKYPTTRTYTVGVNLSF